MNDYYYDGVEFLASIRSEGYRPILLTHDQWERCIQLWPERYHNTRVVKKPSLLGRLRGEQEYLVCRNVFPADPRFLACIRTEMRNTSTVMVDGVRVKVIVV